MSLSRTLGVTIVATAMFFGCSSPPSASRTSADPGDKASVPAGDGVSLSVRSLGRPGGRVVIIVHGGPGLDLESLDALNPLAAGNRRLVGYDQRGAGRSSRPANNDYGIESQLGDLDTVIRWTGASQVDLVGASWGGLLAAAYAGRHPTNVRSLVLLDAAPLDFREFEAGERRFADRAAQLQAERLVPLPIPPDDRDSCLPSLTALLPVYLGDPHEQPPRRVFSSCTASTAKATFNALRQRGQLDDLAAGLTRFHGPALIVAGERDPFGPPWPDRIAQLLPGSRVERLTVAGAGHIPYVERADIVEPRLEHFLP